MKPSVQQPFEQAESRLKMFYSWFQSVGDPIRELRNLYYNSSVDQVTKCGIVRTMQTIYTAADLTRFLSVQTLLIQAAFPRSPLPRDAPYLTFFYFAGLYSSTPSQSAATDPLYPLFQSLVSCLSSLSFSQSSAIIFIERLFALGDDGSYPITAFSAIHYPRVYHVLYERVRSYELHLANARRLFSFSWNDDFVIIPTNGDLHPGSCSPLKVIHHGAVWYYKLRSTLPELYLNMVLGLFNKYAPAQLVLPLLNIQCPLSANPQLALFAEVQHTTSMDSASATAYAHRLGALSALAKIFGLTDLHYSNIMATAAGPVIIDAECLFLLHIIYSKKLSATGIGDLFGVRASGQICDFMVDGQSFTTTFHSSQAYRAAFSAGYQTACAICSDHLPEFYAIFQQALLNPAFSPRIVPLSTASYVNSLSNAVSISSSSDLNIAGAFWPGLHTLIDNQYLTPTTQVLPSYFDRLVHDHMNGFVPIFNIHFGVDNSPGVITIDGLPIVPLAPTPLTILQQNFIHNCLDAPSYLLPFFGNS